MMKHFTKWLGIVAITMTTACAGAPGEDIGGSTSEAVVVPAGTEGLAQFYGIAYVPRCSDWDIPDEVEFQLVDGSLLVALNARGVPVCADDVEAIQNQLRADGRVEESRDLGWAYLVTVGDGIPFDAADPSPQPSDEGPCDVIARNASAHIRGDPDDHVEEGDPSPQPSVQACRTEGRDL